MMDITLNAKVRSIRGVGWFLKHFVVSTKEGSLTYGKAGDDEGPPVEIVAYHPSSYQADKDYPIVLHGHGGGFVAGTAGDDGEYLSYLANKVNCVCLSVEYALAPENPFPGGVNSFIAAAKWAMKKYRSRKIVFSGFSAGGNISLGAAVSGEVYTKPSLSFSFLSPFVP